MPQLLFQEPEFVRVRQQQHKPFIQIGFCQTLSEVYDGAGELVVPDHPVQGRGVALHRVGRHPVRVDKLDPRQADGLDPAIDLLD